MAFATIDMTNGITGTIPVANGGTGLASGTSGQFLKFTGSTTIASSAVSAGKVLQVVEAILGSSTYSTSSSYKEALSIGGGQDVQIPNGSVSDSKGNLRDIPKNSQNAQVTIGTTHAGEVVATSSGGWDIPTGVMSPGNTVTLLNDHSGDLPITTNLTILYNTADGVRIENSTLNLGARGMATIYFWSANAAYIQASSLTVS